MRYNDDKKAIITIVFFMCANTEQNIFQNSSTKIYEKISRCSGFYFDSASNNEVEPKVVRTVIETFARRSYFDFEKFYVTFLTTKI